MSQSASDFRLMGKEVPVRRERWEHIKEIFDQVLARDEAEREGFLAEACGGDADLLAELRSLLAAFAEGFLEPPSLERIESEPRREPDSLVGVQVADGANEFSERSSRDTYCLARFETYLNLGGSSLDLLQDSFHFLVWKGDGLWALFTLVFR